ncbi:MAG: hypothetical protein RIS70_3086, partial [Planctomycetota bacterium]
MFILDRYILQQFFKVLLVGFVALASLYVIIDAFTNLDEFQIYAERQGRNILAIVYDYYRIHSLSVFDKTYGMLALLAAMATITWLQRSRELTAILAGGITKWRVVAPILAATVVVSGLGMANREWWMPAHRAQLTRNAQDWLGDTPRAFTPRYDHRTDIFFTGRAVVRSRQRIERPNFRLPTTLSEFGDKLVADSAVYYPPEGDRPAGFLLDKVERPENLASRPSCSLDGEPVLLSPSDTDWLEPRQCFVVSQLTFEQIATGDLWQRFSSTSELIHELGNPSYRVGAETRVIIHSRFLQPFLDVTLVMLGLPLVLRRENQNLVPAITGGLAVVCGFSVLLITCHGLGANYLLSP